MLLIAGTDLETAASSHNRTTATRIHAVFVKNFVGAKLGALEITPANRQLLRSGYSRRRPEELPVLTRCVWLRLFNWQCALWCGWLCCLQPQPAAARGAAGADQVCHCVCDCLHFCVEHVSPCVGAACFDGGC